MKSSNIIKAQRTWTAGGGGGAGPTPPSGCCYTTITVAGIQALKTVGNLVQGEFYQITNVTSDWQVVVMAESTTTVSSQGQGIFQNLLFTEAWYDVDFNTIYKIYDPKYNNEVEGFANIANFFWNNSDWHDNKILGESTYFVDGLSGLTGFYDNYIFSGNVYFQNGATGGDFYGNNIVFSSINIDNSVVGTVRTNTLSGNCNIDFLNGSNISVFEENTFLGGSYALFNNGTSMVGGFYRNTFTGGGYFISDEGTVVSVWSNTVSDGSYIRFETYGGIAPSIGVDIRYNIITSGSGLQLRGCSIVLSVEYNSLSSGSYMNLYKATLAGELRNNFMNDQSYVEATDFNGGTIAHNCITTRSYIDVQGAQIGIIGNNFLTSEGYIDCGDTYCFEVQDNFVSGESFLEAIQSSISNQINGNTITNSSSLIFNNQPAASQLRYNTVSDSSTIFAPKSPVTPTFITYLEYNNLSDQSEIQAFDATISSIKNNKLTQFSTIDATGNAIGQIDTNNLIQSTINITEGDYCNNNTLSNFGVLNLSSGTATLADNNTIIGGIVNLDNNCDVQECMVLNGGTLTLDNSTFLRCKVGMAKTVAPYSGYSWTNGSLEDLDSTYEVFLNPNVAGVMDMTGYRFAGIVRIGTTGVPASWDLKTINNFPTDHIFCIVPADSNTVDVYDAGAGGTNIYLNVAAVVTYDGTADDTLVVRSGLNAYTRLFQIGGWQAPSA